VILEPRSSGRDTRWFWKYLYKGIHSVIIVICQDMDTTKALQRKTKKSSREKSCVEKWRLFFITFCHFWIFMFLLNNCKYARLESHYVKFMAIKRNLESSTDCTIFMQNMYQGIKLPPFSSCCRRILSTQNYRTSSIVKLISLPQQ